MNNDKLKNPIVRVRKKCVCAANNRPSLPLTATEDSEHMALAVYLEARFGKYGWYHPANERMSSVQGYVKLKRKGTKAGFPDILIFRAPSRTKASYACMAIELKRPLPKGGIVSEEQAAWLRELELSGFYTCVAYGAEDAKSRIEEVYGKYNR